MYIIYLYIFIYCFSDQSWVTEISPINEVVKYIGFFIHLSTKVFSMTQLVCNTNHSNPVVA